MAYDSAHPEREQALSLYSQQTADEEIRPSAIEPAEAFRAGWDACVVRHPHQDVEARNGEPCDCETPGDWHRVANDFQRAMFTERTRAETVEAEVERLREALESIAGMGGALASAGDVARAALASSPDQPSEAPE